MAADPATYSSPLPALFAPSGGFVAVAAQEAVLRFQPVVAPPNAGQFELRAHGGQHAGVLPGFLDEVARAPAHGFHGEIDGGPGGHDDHGRRALGGEQAAEKVQAFLAAGGVARVVQVDEREVEFFLLHGGHGFRRGRDRHGLEALPFEQQAQGIAHGGLIVGNEDAAKSGWPCGQAGPDRPGHAQAKSRPGRPPLDDAEDFPRRDRCGL